jgi:hypothetical protein
LLGSWPMVCHLGGSLGANRGGGVRETRSELAPASLPRVDEQDRSTLAVVEHNSDCSACFVDRQRVRCLVQEDQWHARERGLAHCVPTTDRVVRLSEAWTSRELSKPRLGTMASSLSEGDALYVEEDYDGALAAYSDVSAASISQPPVPHQQEEGSIAPCTFFFSVATMVSDPFARCVRRR